MCCRSLLFFLHGAKLEDAGEVSSRGQFYDLVIQESKVLGVKRVRFQSELIEFAFHLEP